MISFCFYNDTIYCRNMKCSEVNETGNPYTQEWYLCFQKVLLVMKNDLKLLYLTKILSVRLTSRKKYSCDWQ